MQSLRLFLLSLTATTTHADIFRHIRRPLNLQCSLPGFLVVLQLGVPAIMVDVLTNLASREDLLLISSYKPYSVPSTYIVERWACILGIAILIWGEISPI